MDDFGKRVEELLARVRREAQQLRVKVHLAKMEASDEWHELEKKLVALEAKAQELSGVTAEAAGDIGAAAKLLGEELRTAWWAASTASRRCR